MRRKPRPVHKRGPEPLSPTTWWERQRTGLRGADDFILRLLVIVLLLITAAGIIWYELHRVLQG
jgi:hypothetical protein